MNRLQSELHRLYLLTSPEEGGRLMDEAGQVRAMVLELAAPADWEALSKVWRGVQLDLGWPAPAIAVSGLDGLQLWFSLRQPVSADRAAAALAQLQARYLPDIAMPARLRLSPSAAGFAAGLVPAEQAQTGNWSAFVAPDLAPVFVDTPWLDIPPGGDGQADLLARLEGIKPDAFDALVQDVRPVTVAPMLVTQPTGDVDPRRFLQQVLNDETVELALRIEAAKALLR
ncbi:hypothetical protein ACS5PN_30415 [Roseateles sp. NT4]|uniref:hypothetical protein n=1 Tax=Roseateles sp. NT4 TaxID=3453715 RepID=UPI003EE91CC3